MPFNDQIRFHGMLTSESYTVQAVRCHACKVAFVSYLSCHRAGSRLNWPLSGRRVLIILIFVRRQ
jgi:hypothetical protein